MVSIAARLPIPGALCGTYSHNNVESVLLLRRGGESTWMKRVVVASSWMHYEKTEKPDMRRYGKMGKSTRHKAPLNP